MCRRRIAKGKLLFDWNNQPPRYHVGEDFRDHGMNAGRVHLLPEEKAGDGKTRLSNSMVVEAGNLAAGRTDKHHAATAPQGGKNLRKTRSPDQVDDKIHASCVGR